MSEQIDAREKKYPIKQSATFAGGTFVTMGLVDLLAHLGPTGMLVGGLASYVAWKHGPELLEYIREQVKENFPERDEQEDEQPQKQGRTFWEWAWGIHPEDEVKGIPERSTDNKPSAAKPQGVIDLAPDLQLQVQEVAGKAIFVCGIRRHGKTTIGARLAEQLGLHYIPMLIPDLEGDYISLADVLPRAVIAGHSSVAGQYKHYEFVALDENEAAFRFGYDMLEYGYQVILDLTSYEQLDTAITMQVNMIRGMFAWANAHPDTRVPSYVYLDEAQRFLPQNLSDSIILSKALLMELLRCYMEIIAVGGKRGISPVILSQRMAQVNNKIMAQSEIFFLLRQTNDNDLDRVMEYVKKAIATKEQISAFQPGQGVFISADGRQLVTRFHERTSSGKRSQTPQADAASRYAAMPMKRSAQPVAQRDEPETDKLPVPVTEPAQPKPTLLQRAITAYDDGATSGPKLAAALNISLWEVRDVLAQVKREISKREQLAE